MKANKLFHLFLITALMLNFKVLNAQDTLAISQMPVDTSWKTKAEFGVNVNQGSFSSNWTNGGVNSIALGLLFNGLAAYDKGNHTWRNDMQTQFGIVSTEALGRRKNIDRIFLDSKYGYKFSPKWSFIGNVNFQTQFARGYIYENQTDGSILAKKQSAFMSPGYLTESIGFEYKPVDYFFITFAPGALRQTFVTDTTLYVNTPDQLNFGVPIHRKVRSEMALMQVVANFDKNIAKDVNLKFRYQGFANIRTLDAIDHRLDASITAKVNKYVNVNLGMIAIFDKDQDASVQFAQSLALGFLYTF